MSKRKIPGSLLLLMAAFIWGNGFVAQKIGIQMTGPLTFATARFLIGGIAMIPFAICSRKSNQQQHATLASAKRNNQINAKKILITGFICGFFLAAGTILQQAGMRYTSAGKAGFITALYIIFVPLFGLFVNRKASLGLWLSVAAAAAGLYLLCVTEGLSVNIGDLLVLLCAIVFSFHILFIDRYAPKFDSIPLSCAQFFSAALVSGILMVIFERTDIRTVLASWLPLVYLGIFSGALGFTLQIIGQKNADPTVASLMLSMESVFAAVAGWLFLNEHFTLRELLGCVIVFGAVLLSQVSFGKTNEKIMPDQDIVKALKQQDQEEISAESPPD